MLAALCAVLFLREALVPGRSLVPYPPEVMDVQGAQRKAAGLLSTPEQLAEVGRGNVSMGDKYNQSLCWDRVLETRLRQGEVPLWTRDIGGGASFVPQMAQVWQPWNALLLVLPAEQWYGWFVFGHLVLGGWLAWWFLRSVGLGQPAALLGLTCAVLGLWTQCKLHHNVILTASLSLWPALGCVHAIARGSRSLRTVGSLALWTGLSWSSGFAVVALQVSYLSVGWALWLCLGNPRGQRLAPLVRTGCAMALGGMLSLAQMGPVLLAATESARTAAPGLDPGARALELDHLLTLAWPDLLCWASDRFQAQPELASPFAAPTRPPWSQLVLLSQPTDAAGSTVHNWVECSFSLGIAALACAAAAFGNWNRRRAALALGAVAALGFGIASGATPFVLLAKVLPGLGAADLRRLLFVTSSALVVLAALGAERIVRDGPGRLVRGLVGTLALASGLALLWLLQQDENSFVDATAALLARDATNPLVQQAGGSAQALAAGIRAAMRPGEALGNLDALVVTATRALAVSLLVLLALAARRPALRIGLLCALAAGELLHAGLGPVQTVESNRVRTPPLVVQPVLDAAPEQGGFRPRMQRLGSREDARVQSLYPPNLGAFHGIEDLSAYNPLPPARMEELFRCIEPDVPGKVPVAFGGAGVGWFHDAASLHHPLCDLLGIRFVLCSPAAAAEAGLVDRTPAGTGGFRLLERTTALPRLTMVHQVECIPDKAARLARLADPARDVQEVVVLESPATGLPVADPRAGDARIEVVQLADERVVLTVETPAAGWLRLADPWDPGWTAAIDGTRVTVHVADHHLRAVFVPRGRSTVEFRYDALVVVWPQRIALLALLLVLGLLACRSSRS
ncbi:MAG: hypothetical protein RL148_2683 [Planctomycetota bacterium]